MSGIAWGERNGMARHPDSVVKMVRDYKKAHPAAGPGTIWRALAEQGVRVKVLTIKQWLYGENRK